VSKDLEGSTCI